MSFRSRRARFALAPMVAAALLALVPLTGAGAAPQPSQVHVGKTIPLTIHAGRRDIRFRVEVARTPADQELGLMFRKSMPANHGMVFLMGGSAIQSFWMRNTLIPLDIIYIRADGTISSIADARPLDETPIPSLEPVPTVLELNGGTAKRLGIKPGDQVRW